MSQRPKAKHISAVNYRETRERTDLITGITRLKERVKLLEDFLNEPYEVEQGCVTLIIQKEFEDYVKSRGKDNLGSVRGTT